MVSWVRDAFTIPMLASDHYSSLKIALRGDIPCDELGTLAITSTQKHRVSTTRASMVSFYVWSQAVKSIAFGG